MDMGIANVWDKEELKQLWRSSFEDEERFVRFFFKELFPYATPFVCIVGKQIVCAAYLFPAQIMTDSGESIRVGYVYGVSTYPQHRGFGYATELLNFICVTMAQQEYSGIVLVPQSQSLFDFYKDRGFTSLCSIGKLQGNRSSEKISTEKMSMGNFVKRRKQLLFKLNTAMNFSQELSSLQYKALDMDGCDFLDFTGGYACVKKKETHLEIREILCGRDSCEQICGSLASLYDCDTYEAATAEAGEMTPFALIRWIREETPMRDKNVYINLIFN